MTTLVTPRLNTPDTGTPPLSLDLPASPPAWVNDYVGLPWADLGRDTGRDPVGDRAGLDCWGLLRRVLWERAGVAVSAYTGVGYHRDAAARDGLAAFIAAEAEGGSSPWRPTPPGAERLLDGLLLRVRGQPIHVGLVVARGWMLHIEEGCNAVQERYDDMRWARRVIGVYRHEALARR